MRPVISRDDVERVMNELAAAGKKSTVAAVHGALGGRGSITTVIKYMDQIKAAAAAERDSQEAMRVFRELWMLATSEGRKQKEAEIEDKQGAIDALMAESEAQEGGSTVAAQTIATLETEQDSLLAELRQCREQLATSRASSDGFAKKLSEANDRNEVTRATCEAEIADLRTRLTSREIELGRVTEQVTGARMTVDQYAGRLAEVQERIEGLRSANVAETAQLRTQLAHEQQRAHALEIALARAEGRLESHPPKLGLA